MSIRKRDFLRLGSGAAVALVAAVLPAGLNFGGSLPVLALDIALAKDGNNGNGNGNGGGNGNGNGGGNGNGEGMATVAATATAVPGMAMGEFLRWWRIFYLEHRIVSRIGSESDISVRWLDRRPSFEWHH